MKVEIYTKDNCSHCINAKQLLKHKNIEFTEFKIGVNSSVEELKARMPSAKTVPQIWIDDNYIGGNTELKLYLSK